MMKSEMQERIARTIYERTCPRCEWDELLADDVKEPFRADALAVMKAMREPTQAQGRAALNLTGKEVVSQFEISGLKEPTDRANLGHDGNYASGSRNDSSGRSERRLPPPGDDQAAPLHCPFASH